MFLCFKVWLLHRQGLMSIPHQRGPLGSLADVSCDACGCCRALDAAKAQVAVQQALQKVAQRGHDDMHGPFHILQELGGSAPCSSSFGLGSLC